MSRGDIGENFAVLPTFDESAQKELARLLGRGWTVVGITSAENSGGVWAMLVAPSDSRRNDG